MVQTPLPRQLTPTVPLRPRQPWGSSFPASGVHSRWVPGELSQAEMCWLYGSLPHLPRLGLHTPASAAKGASLGPRWPFLATWHLVTCNRTAVISVCSFFMQFPLNQRLPNTPGFGQPASRAQSLLSQVQDLETKRARPQEAWGS